MHEEENIFSVSRLDPLCAMNDNITEHNDKYFIRY